MNATSLRDRHGRTFDYVRVAVTDQCNLRCVYCMPEEGVDFVPPPALLTGEEILRFLRIAAGLGVSKVRFTGGEPLVRKDIVALVRGARETPGVHEVHLTTNGVLLSRHADDLLRAGLSGVNVSIDTLDPEKFKAITRRAGLERVVAGVREIVSAGLPSVKVNVVAMRGFNDSEIDAFAELTRELPITVRFIELMPFDAHQIWKTGKFFGAERIIEALRSAFPTLVDATGSRTEHHVFRIPGHAGKLSVIPAYTRTLCTNCNRIRLTADGQIRNCLYSQHEYDVRALLRSGASDAAVVEQLVSAMWAKEVDGWAAQRSNGTRPLDVSRLSMTQIGG
jgi:cyclic pyranopterin phosphate synthase